MRREFKQTRERTMDGERPKSMDFNKHHSENIIYNLFEIEYYVLRYIYKIWSMGHDENLCINKTAL